MALVKTSKRTIASYVLDWVALAAMGLICYGLNKITPVYHPFSLLDLNIAFPMRTELVSTASLIIASVIGPGVVMAAVSLFLIPGPSSIRTTPWQQQLVRKIWEINVAWLGLGLSELTALLLTTGLKNIIGKPRPDLLSRCNPDLNAIQQHFVGGITGDISPAWVLVDQGICQQQDMSILNDGFRSFPSGHSSTSWSGLLYLGLWLCAKFGVAFPYLPPFSRLASSPNSPRSRRYAGLRQGSRSLEAERKPIFGVSSFGKPSPFVGRRSEGAAPPAYLQFLLYIPVGVALFICSSRWFDYRHHGFDIISGSIIGIFCSWYAFNTYHMPLGRGAGWSWGPRSSNRAFAIGVGTEGWAYEEDEDDDDEAVAHDGPNDLEMGALRNHSPGAANDPERPGNSEPLPVPGYGYVDQYAAPGSAR